MAACAQLAVKWVGKALLGGDFAAILPLYCDTVAVFLPGSVYRLQGADEIRAALEEHAAGAASAGVLALRGAVAAVGLPRGWRSRVFVDWTYDMGEARPLRRASAVYYMNADRGRPRIEMIEYRSLAFRASRRWHRGRALVAPARMRGAA